MIILVIKTDSSEAYLALYDVDSLIAEHRWESGRELARDLLAYIVDLLKANHLTMSNVGALACFAGPGSFTSLRIGHTTANTLAYSQGIPIVAGSGDTWLSDTIQRLSSGENDKIILPNYGSEPHITPPRK